MVMSGSDEEKIAFWRLLLAELVGTFILVFVDAGGAVIADLAGDSEVTAAARAIASGFTVMALIFSFGHVSGAHINPAVSLAFYLRGVFPLCRLPAYWAAQLLGAVLAAGLLVLLFGAAIAAVVNEPPMGVLRGLGMEIVLTALLITVILSTAQRMKVTGPNAAIPVGATVALCALIARPVSDAVMNPARALGPALLAWDFSQLWIYIVAPLLGAVLAVWLAWGIHGQPNDTEREAAQGEKDPAH